MRQKIDNQLKECTMNDYIGGNQTNNYISVSQKAKHKFIITHNTNIKPVSYFTGREAELQTLRKKIETERESVLISGMGGIGKTQICRKLFDEYTAHNGKCGNEHFRHIGYIEYNGDMNSSLQECLRYKHQEDPELDMKAAWAKLEQFASKGNLLLFVDNVDKFIHEDPGLQRLSQISGVIVLTSRLTSFSDEYEPIHIVSLSTMQCREIYEKIRFENSGKKMNPDELQDLEYIIGNLAGNHTLTVQFLANLARIKSWPVRRLRVELEERGFCLEFHKNGELVNIQKSYETLYNLSQLSDAEQNVLEAFSLFPYIPLKSNICNQWLLSDAGVSEENDTFAGLYEKGWLQFETKSETYALHPVFAQFIYEKYKPKSVKHPGLLYACQKNLEISKNGSPLLCLQYLPFAENIIEKLNMEDDPRVVAFVYATAYLLLYISEYKKAKTLNEKLLQLSKKIFGQEHPNTACIYNNLANAYERQGEFKKAEVLCKKSLRIYKKVLGAEHPNTVVVYNNLADIYNNQGRYKKAEELYKKSLRIRKKFFGDEHPSTAVCYNNLANVYMHQGEYRKAEELRKMYLRICVKILGEKHLNTAIGYNNLADVYKNQGKYKEAGDLFEKSLQILVKILGEEHPNTANIYNNLADMYNHQSNYKKAEELYKNCLQIYIKILGEEHLDTIAVYNNLASVYKNQGEYRKAEELYKKSLRVRVEVLGEGHPDTAVSYNNLAGIYKKQGEYRKAEELYKKSLRVRAEVLGREHPETATTYNNLAGVYEHQGEYAKAEELYKMSLRIRVKVFGEEHSDTAASYNNLASMYASQGKYIKAKELFLKSLQINKKVLGEEHPETATSYGNLATVYSDQGEYGKAKKLHEKSLQIRKKILGEMHPNTAISYNNLAKVYWFLGDYKTALTYYLNSYKVLICRLGTGHPHIQLIYDNMKIVYDEWITDGKFELWLKENMTV